MTKEQFKMLKEKFGDYASFMIWKDEKHVNDISMFDDDNIAEKLNTKFVFVALNPAGSKATNEEVAPAFKNFHSDYAYQKDFKLCYAAKDTKYWGSYITDLFKSFHLTDSSKLNKELKDRPEDVEKDIEALREELAIINKDAILIALGRKTEHYLKKLFKDEYEIRYVMHYSYRSHMKDYKKVFLDTLGE